MNHGTTRMFLLLFGIAILMQIIGQIPMPVIAQNIAYGVTLAAGGLGGPVWVLRAGRL